MIYSLHPSNFKPRNLEPTQNHPLFTKSWTCWQTAEPPTLWVVLRWKLCVAEEPSIQGCGFILQLLYDVIPTLMKYQNHNWILSVFFFLQNCTISMFSLAIWTHLLCAFFRGCFILSVFLTWVTKQSLHHLSASVYLSCSEQALGIDIIHHVILLSATVWCSCPPAPEPCRPDGPCIIKTITLSRDLTLSQHWK